VFILIAILFVIEFMSSMGSSNDFILYTILTLQYMVAAARQSLVFPSFSIGLDGQFFIIRPVSETVRQSHKKLFNLDFYFLIK